MMNSYTDRLYNKTCLATIFTKPRCLYIKTIFNISSIAFVIFVARLPKLKPCRDIFVFRTVLTVLFFFVFHLFQVIASLYSIFLPSDDSTLCQSGLASIAYMFHVLASIKAMLSLGITDSK